MKMLEVDYIYQKCSKCKRRIGCHSIIESYCCGLLTKDEAREASIKQYGIIKTYRYGLLTKDEAREACNKL